MRKTLFAKTFLGHLLIILVLTALVLIAADRLVRSFFLNSLTSDLERLGTTLKPQIKPFLEEGRLDDLDEFVKEMGQAIRTRITVIDGRGLVLADSEHTPREMDDHHFRPEILRALSGTVGRSIRYSRTVEADMLYVGLPISRGGELTEVLRLSLFISDITRFLARFRRDLFGIVGLITLLALGLAYINARRMTRPLDDLKRASRRVAEGDFNARIFSKRKGELRELGDAFNLMTSRIRELFGKLDQKNNELDNLLESMEEGLVALDSQGCIRLANRSFRNITGNRETVGKFFWEVIRDPGFQKTVGTSFESKGPAQCELVLNGRVFRCSAAYLETLGEAVITFHDITEIKAVEKIKKDFVVNVSHELRTPLTSIKGFIETLKENAENPEARGYLEIIERNTDRLIHIVNDLLLLSEMEEKGSRMEKEPVDVAGLLRNSMRIFENAVSEKGLKVEWDIQENLPTFSADPFRLEQMFINLLDNAVKYTDKGGIAVRGRQDNGWLIVEIEDSGIGINEKDFPRIFERFYVTDKVRTRSQGGTGLGLAIVKHIAALHGGEVNVRSTAGKGSLFTVRLPLT